MFYEQKDKRIIINVLGLKINFKSKNYINKWVMYIPKLIVKLKINYLRKKYIKDKNYKIISLGQTCLPRVITTLNGLKPRRADGERSCPFDLAFSDNIDKSIELIDSHFEYFYNDLFFDEKLGCWHNPTISLRFFHDRTPNKEEFIARYDNRIKNFYNYINSKEHIFFLISTFTIISKEQIEKLNNTITKFRDKNSFDIIIINQGKTKNTLNYDNVHTVEQYHNFDNFQKINSDPDWASALKSLYLKEAQTIYKEISTELIRIISQS